MSTAAETLRCRDVHVTLGGHRILSGVDLTLRRGEVTVLVGPNGAGKSTLFSVLAGDLSPRSGTVHVRTEDGADPVPVSEVRPRALARVRAVQMQDSRLSFAFTARATVEMGRAPWAGTAEEERDEAVVEHALGLSETRALAQQPVPVLSGGERARVAFARALAQETGVLLLDEPTAALDIRHQERVFAAVAERAAAGATVLVIVHDLSLAAAYADRIVLLHEGRVRADGPPSQVLDAALLSEVYDHPVAVTTVPGTDELLVVPLRGRPAAPCTPPPPHLTPPLPQAQEAIA